MSGDRRRHVVLANGAAGPPDAQEPLVLHYLEGKAGQRLRLALPKFVRNVYHIPHRVLDLLEIAAYVYGADRSISRGPKDAVEYQAWSRSIEFHIRVRDHDFWCQPQVRDVLKGALEFATGDALVEFHFEPGHSTPPTDLFDAAQSEVPRGPEAVAVALFSGGIDSLAGALELLQTRESIVILVSHRSQPGTTRTRRQLVEALKQRCPGRVYYYEFECTLRGVRAVDETQRTRSFLYTAIAYAIASAYKEDSISVFENGVTSLNLYRREDLANARASRTTHPQTMGRFSRLLSQVAGADFTIDLPFLFHTKTDVMQKLKSCAPELLPSSVSCSRTFQLEGEATHCGYCFQCVDRRFAAHAASADDFDHRGLYVRDIITQPIEDREARTVAVDYIRQAISCAESSLDQFATDYFSELADVLDYLPCACSETDKVTRLWDLFRTHGTQVKYGIERMRGLYDDVFKSLELDSLLGLIAAREYLKPEVGRLAESIASILRAAIPEMFAKNRPKDEPDLNQKVGALLRTHETKMRSEHPTVSFACARVVPDHSLQHADLLIELKYIRHGTPPSKATEGIASDLTKYPPKSFILFVVYDPDHCIASDSVFCADIEAKGRNHVLIVR